MANVTPGTVMRGFWTWFGVGVFAFVVVAVVVLVGWNAGWWFANQNATREAHMIRNGYSNQQSLREQITQQIANVNTITVQIASTNSKSQRTALKSQRASIAGEVCQDASEVTGDPLPAQQASWVRLNCRAGVVSPSSTYFEAGTQ